MIRVLVLDDDVYVGRLHCTYVDEVPGFEALPPVRDLRAAREVLAGGEVDLLLADYVLPDGNGVDLIREADVDAAVLSAVAESATIRQALRAGALTYILKPFDAGQLQDFLRRYARFHRFWDRDKLEQGEVDSVLRRLHDATAVGSGPKRSGSSSTTDRIFAALESAGSPLTAVEVAEAVGTSRATAQRHLAKLAEARTVVVSLQYGSTGRPEHLYGTK